MLAGPCLQPTHTTKENGGANADGAAAGTADKPAKNTRAPTGGPGRPPGRSTKMDEREIMGAIQAEMGKKGMRYAEIYDKSGVARATILRWLRGDGSGQLVTVLAVLEALGLEMIVREKGRPLTGGDKPL